MSETPAQPPAPPAVPAEPAQAGFFERIAEHLPHSGHAAADGAVFAEDVKAAIKAHAGTCFDVAGDVLQLLELADPGDAAAEELAGKVLAMAGSAAKIAGAVHSA